MTQTGGCGEQPGPGQGECTAPGSGERDHPGCAGRARTDRGAASIELGLGAAVLLLPVAVVVLTLPTWVERQSAARVAAREAARTAVTAESSATALAAGKQAAAEVAANHGLDPGAFEVAITGSFERHGSIAATVTAHFPATAFFGFTDVAAFTWSVTHTEKVDRYRSITPPDGP